MTSIDQDDLHQLHDGGAEQVPTETSPGMTSTLARVASNDYLMTSGNKILLLSRDCDLT